MTPFSISPDGTVGIEKVGNQYFFVDSRLHKRVGNALPGYLRSGISNVSVATSWSIDSRKVAVLMFYGAKMNCISLHSRKSGADFEEIEFDEPDVGSVLKLGFSSDSSVNEEHFFRKVG